MVGRNAIVTIQTTHVTSWLRNSRTNHAADCKVSEKVFFVSVVVLKDINIGTRGPGFEITVFYS